jgi:threonylcarbamoyladenosine tRNA methylthiotransferase MtaB
MRSAAVETRGFHTITLGCKLNQFDTAAIEGELARRGYRHEEDAARASVVIVNTCTVTGKAEADARKRIRGVVRKNPDCRLLVTGCHAELDPDSLRAIDGVDFVFGNRDKRRLAAILDTLQIGESRVETEPFRPATGDRGCDAALELPPALHFGDRSRAFLKVQEGCRLSCSYCIIPTVRGPSRSVSPERVLEAADSLLASGYREIVLTGVNVGDYGRDLTPRVDLGRLLRRLLARCGPNRIRLNSLEPLTVTDEIVELMAAEPRLAPHLQVPLQSGSPVVLRGMRRNYRLEQYLDRLSLLRRKIPHVGLGADVIVGFPGESARRFEETSEFIAASPLNYMHVFSWSARPGTDAAELPERVHGSEVRRRSSRLRALGQELSYRFRETFSGRRLDAVPLAPREDGRVRALTGNFIEVSLDPGTAARGELVRVRVTDVTRDDTRAVVDGLPTWAGATGRPSASTSAT